MKTYYCWIYYTQYIILSSQPLKVIRTILQTRKLGTGGDVSNLYKMLKIAK